MHFSGMMLGLKSLQCFIPALPELLVAILTPVLKCFTPFLLTNLLAISIELIYLACIIFGLDATICNRLIMHYSSWCLGLVCSALLWHFLNILRFCFTCKACQIFHHHIYCATCIIIVVLFFYSCWLVESPLQWIMYGPIVLSIVVSDHS